MMDMAVSPIGHGVQNVEHSSLGIILNSNLWRFPES